MKTTGLTIEANTCKTLKFSALATILILLASCGHHPHKGAAAGEKFLGDWKIKTVYHDPGKKREDPPIRAGGNLELVRQNGSSNTFELIAGDSFEGEPAWNGLTLRYQPGSDRDTPAPLISELCAGEKTAADRKGQYGYIEADVQDDFLNLKGRELEFLESQPVVFGEDKHIVHIYRLLKIGDKQPGLLIFYCRTSHCNHRGAAHAEL